MEIENQIRKFIANNLLFASDGLAYPDDASFLKEGIVDSIGVMELVSFLQERFDITPRTDEITPDNFDSVAKLAGFVRRKQATDHRAAELQPPAKSSA